jgi:hypothetical protein
MTTSQQFERTMKRPRFQIIETFLVIVLISAPGGCRTAHEFQREVAKPAPIVLEVLSSSTFARNDLTFRVAVSLAIENSTSHSIVVYPDYVSAFVPIAIDPLMVLPRVSTLQPDFRHLVGGVILVPHEKRTFNIKLCDTFYVRQPSVDEVKFDLIYDFNGLRSKSSRAELRITHGSQAGVSIPQN